MTLPVMASCGGKNKNKKNPGLGIKPGLGDSVFSFLFHKVVII